MWALDMELVVYAPLIKGHGLQESYACGIGSVSFLLDVLHADFILD